MRWFATGAVIVACSGAWGCATSHTETGAANEPAHAMPAARADTQGDGSGQLASKLSRADRYHAPASASDSERCARDPDCSTHSSAVSKPASVGIPPSGPSQPSEPSRISSAGAHESTPEPGSQPPATHPPAPTPGEAKAEASSGAGSRASRELALADAAYERDELDRAALHYERARKLDPRTPAALVGLVRTELAQSGISTGFAEAQGNSRVAALLRRVEAAVKLDDNYAPAWIEKGRLLLMQGEAEKARVALERASALDPNDAEGQSAYGVALLAIGQTQPALVHLQRASELDPNNPERLTNLGTALMMRGRVTEAIRAYAAAVRIAPGNARAEADLGTAHLAQNRPDLALPYLKRAVELEPERATFLSNLGYAYQLSGDLQRAIVTYREAIAKDKTLASAWINLGNGLALQGKLDEAERALRHALRLDPSDPRAQASLADLEELKKKPTE